MLLLSVVMCMHSHGTSGAPEPHSSKRPCLACQLAHQPSLTPVSAVPVPEALQVDRCVVLPSTPAPLRLAVMVPAGRAPPLPAAVALS